MTGIEISLIVGVVSLLVERLASWANKIRKSSCGTCCTMERDNVESSPIINQPILNNNQNAKI